MQRESVTDPVALQRVDKLAISTESLNKLFSGLLDLSRLDGGSIVPERRDICLRDLFDQLGNDARERCAAQGLELHVAEVSAWVHTDPIWLERIVRNLIDNAIKYTMPGGSISLSCSARGDNWRISVRDTGVGIALEHQRHIFEEYYQVHNPARDRSQGVGLGLAIVKRACDLLGHPIEMQSQLGHGSTFSILLPSSLARLPVASDEPIPVSQASEFAGMVVVVVEDDPDAAEVTEALFSQWGCMVVTCASADQGVARLAARGMRPQAIIADYRLANGARGTAAIARLREAFGPLPAAVVTGEMDAAELQGQASHDPVLQKPLTAARLRELLRGFLPEPKT